MVRSHQTYPPQDNIVIYDWKFYKSTRIKGTERNLENGPPQSQNWLYDKGDVPAQQREHGLSVQWTIYKQFKLKIYIIPSMKIYNIDFKIIF